MEIKADYILGCISTIVACRSSKVIISPYSVLTRVHLKQCAALEAPVQERDPDKLLQAQKRDSQMVRGLEYTMYEKPLKEPGSFNVEKIKNECNCSLPQTEGGCYKEDRFFSEACSRRTSCNGHELQQGKFLLDKKK